MNNLTKKYNKTYKEKITGPSVSWDKKRIFMIITVLVHSISFFFVPLWIVILSFILTYFVLGLYLTTCVWGEE